MQGNQSWLIAHCAYPLTQFGLSAMVVAIAYPLIPNQVTPPERFDDF